MSLATYKQKVLQYTGTGVAHSETGVGFALNDGKGIVLIKGRNGGSALGGCLRTPEMSGSNSLPLAATAALITDGITSMDADGFTVGVNNRVNQLNAVYVAICISIGTGHYVKSGSYSGDAVDGRTITIDATGWQLNGILIAGATGANDVWRGQQMSGDESAILAASTQKTDLVQSVTTTGFTIGTDSRVNGSGDTFYWVAWRRHTSDLDAAMMMGSYSGSGAQQTITVSFSPAATPSVVIVHGGWVAAIGTFWRHTSHPTNEASSWATSADGNPLTIEAQASNSFQVDTTLSQSGATHHYLAFVAIASLSVSLTEPTFTADEAIAGDSIGLSWAEFKDAGGTTRVHSHVPLPDASDYYGGFKEGRLTAWTAIRRALSDWRGQFEGVTFGWTVADTDRSLRGLLAASATRFFTGRPAAIRAINDVDRRARKGARTLARGLVSGYKLVEPFLFVTR